MVRGQGDGKISSKLTENQRNSTEGQDPFCLQLSPPPPPRPPIRHYHQILYLSLFISVIQNTIHQIDDVVRQAQDIQSQVYDLIKVKSTSFYVRELFTLFTRYIR